MPKIIVSLNTFEATTKGDRKIFKANAPNKGHRSFYKRVSYPSRIVSEI